MAPFRVMTWNLENLYRAKTKYGPKTQAEYTQKLQALVSVILNLAPDVIAVQEVGGTGPFKDLVTKLQPHYPHSLLSTKPDTRGIRVGFLSNLVIEDNEEIVDFPVDGLPSVPGINNKGEHITVTRLGRGALRILVSPSQNFPVNLITAHLKSKLLTFPNHPYPPSFSTEDEDERAQVAGIALLKRTAEAVALRIKANDLLKDNDKNALILLGDMNDVTDAATTQILHGPGGSEIGTTAFNRPDKGDDVRLFNLATLIPKKKRFSRIYKGEMELIDHILVSQELLPGKPRKVPEVESHVDVIGALPSIGDVPSRRKGEPGSDHAPITATFEL